MIAAELRALLANVADDTPIHLVIDYPGTFGVCTLETADVEAMPEDGIFLIGNDLKACSAVDALASIAEDV